MKGQGQINQWVQFLVRLIGGGSWGVRGSELAQKVGGMEWTSGGQ